MDSRSQEAVERYFFPSTPSRASAAVQADLDTVFGSRRTGFRELLATVLYGLEVDPSYDPTVDLYFIHPRPLYERYIRPVLVERGIPCGQSGPLNVAKATLALNGDWASQKRPKSVAYAMLRIVDHAMSLNPVERKELAEEIGIRFDQDALEVKLTQNDLTPVESAVRLSAAAHDLIETYPLGGASAQALCGMALEAEHRDSLGVTVHGATDSVSTTNATSKKVGDIAIERDGKLVGIFEVTTKEFSEQRISECVQSLSKYFSGHIPSGTVVQVICRPQDVPAAASKSRGGLLMGELITGGVVFEFISIMDWLAAKIVQLTPSGRREYFKEVEGMLNHTSVPSKARIWWASYFDEST